MTIDVDEYERIISIGTPQEGIDAEALSRGSFAERVTLLSSWGNVSSYLVDKLVSVTGPSDAARISAQKHWESEKNRALFWGRLNVALLISSVCCLALLSSGLGFFGPLEITVAAMIVGGAALSALWNYSKADQAQEKIDQWSAHPAQSVADARAKAYSEGFFYAMKEGLKESHILHPNEVTWVYEEHLMATMRDVSVKMQRQNMVPADKANWVSQFIAKNPLSKEAIAYAYDPSNAKRKIMEAWTPSFEAFKQDVAALQSHLSTRIQQVKSQARKQIDDLEEQRNQALKPLLSFRKTSDAEARRVRTDRLRAEGISIEGRREVERRYNQALLANESHYLEASTPITLYYDSWRKSVEIWEQNCLDQIKQEKDLGLALYFESALYLFNGAYTSWYNQNLSDAHFYKVGSGQIYNDFRPLPSAPPQEALDKRAG